MKKAETSRPIQKLSNEKEYQKNKKSILTLKKIDIKKHREEFVGENKRELVKKIMPCTLP